MDAKKALIITWIVIGLVLAGIAGFYLGRSNFGRGLNQLNNIQGPGEGSMQGPAGGNQINNPPNEIPVK